MVRLFRLWRLVGRDLRLLCVALRHPHRPIWLWPATVLLALYALDPVNFALPLAGLVDDFVLIPLLLHWMLKILPADVRAGV